MSASFPHLFRVLDTTYKKHTCAFPPMFNILVAGQVQYMSDILYAGDEVYEDQLANQLIRDYFSTTLRGKVEPMAMEIEHHGALAPNAWGRASEQVHSQARITNKTCL